MANLKEPLQSTSQIRRVHDQQRCGIDDDARHVALGAIRDRDRLVLATTAHTRSAHNNGNDDTPAINIQCRVIASARLDALPGELVWRIARGR
jgi:hypothetical protein